MPSRSLRSEQEQHLFVGLLCSARYSASHRRGCGSFSWHGRVPKVQRGREGFGGNCERTGSELLPHGWLEEQWEEHWRHHCLQLPRGAWQDHGVTRRMKSWIILWQSAIVTRSLIMFSVWWSLIRGKLRHLVWHPFVFFFSPSSLPWDLGFCLASNSVSPGHPCMTHIFGAHTDVRQDSPGPSLAFWNPSSKLCHHWLCLCRGPP